MFATTGLELLFAGGKWRVDRVASVGCRASRVNHLMVETVVGRFRGISKV